MLSTHRDAEERYTLIRKAVLEEVNKEFLNSNLRSLSARLIDGAACTSRKAGDNPHGGE